MKFIHQAAAVTLAAIAVVGAAGAATPEAGTTIDVAVDPAGAWKQFLAHADFDKVYPAFDVFQKLDYDRLAVGEGAQGCKDNAAALRAAVALVPVSLVLHRAAYLCAEVLHDDAAAERELKAIAALAKYAMAGASESWNSAPIRIVRPDDAYALLASAGYEFRYEYYNDRQQRVFPLVVAAWDPERKRERHLRFDFIDTAHRIARTKEAPYPVHRMRVVVGLMDEASSDPAVVDLVAVRDANAASSRAAGLATLRSAAASGGLNATNLWIQWCSVKDAPTGCADGLADAILPFAEKQHALPMALLAYVYDNGLGVKRDAEAADKLLDAADQRWANHGATVAFVNLWHATHKKNTLPAQLRKRADVAAADGNANARMLVFADRMAGDMHQFFKAPSADDVAFLSGPDQNGEGSGYSILSSMADVRSATADKMRYLRLAAEAGDPESQFELGSAYEDGNNGLARDRAAAEQWYAKAADGNHAWSARHVAYALEDKKDFAGAEQMLLGVASTGDEDAIRMLAWMYEYAKPGVSEGPKRAIEVYSSMNDAEAHRRLAQMALDGRGMPKDPAKAKAWLLQDAQKEDADSERRLAQAYIGGEFGEADEREGVRWYERAIAHGDAYAASSYGWWLYYKKATPDTRKQAIDVWRKQLAARRSAVANELAWVRCTSKYDDELDAAEGIKAIALLGADSDDLDYAELDTAAACQAAAGQFDKAKQLQALAIQSLDKDIAGAKPTKDQADTIARFNERMALYASRKPYRVTTE